MRSRTRAGPFRGRQRDCLLLALDPVRRQLPRSPLTLRLPGSHPGTQVVSRPAGVGHEWVPAEGAGEGGDAVGKRVVKDAVGNVLQDGDSVVVVKALKVKGSPSGIKAGTKVRSIRLVDGVDGHDIDCKVDGFGAMQLKSSVVEKA